MKESNSNEIQELVIARLLTIPSNKTISIGNFGEFNRDQLIENVKSGSDVGRKIIEVELEFLRAMKQGIVA